MALLRSSHEQLQHKNKVQKTKRRTQKLVVGHYGLQAWDNLLKEEGRIRKMRQEAIYAQRTKND